jgi:hypothetical protein
MKILENWHRARNPNVSFNWIPVHFMPTMKIGSDRVAQQPDHTCDNNDDDGCDEDDVL